jgi:hypothetical protein
MGDTPMTLYDPTMWPTLLRPFAEVLLFAEGSWRVVTV